MRRGHTCTIHPTAVSGRCPDHPDHPLTTLCSTDGAVICSKCCLGPHKGHDVTDLPPADKLAGMVTTMAGYRRRGAHTLTETVNKVKAVRRALDRAQEATGKALAESMADIRACVRSHCVRCGVVFLCVSMCVENASVLVCVTQITVCAPAVLFLVVVHVCAPRWMRRRPGGLSR